MAICANDKGVLVGRMTRLFLAEGCGDAVPEAGDWKYLGSTTSKGVDYSPQTTTSEADTAGGKVKKHSFYFGTACWSHRPAIWRRQSHNT
jgi:hypothetical protein